MKTSEDIKNILTAANPAGRGYAEIASAWNKEIDDLSEKLGLYFSTTQKHAAKIISLRAKLRKLRQELAEAKGLAGVYFHQKEMHAETISRLESLIERIAKGKR